jgi:hypothetical protein
MAGVGSGSSDCWLSAALWTLFGEHKARRETYEKSTELKARKTVNASALPIPRPIV